MPATLRRAICWSALVTLGIAPWCLAQTVIDDFQHHQTALTLTTPGSINSVVSGSMLGGERDLRLSLSSGSSINARVELGRFTFDQATGVIGSVDIVWDGPGGNATTINYTGLGGLDLTATSQNAFLLGILSLDQAATITLTVYSDATHTSTMALPVPGGIAAPNYFQAPFSAFVGNADFSKAGAIQLTVSSASAATLALDFLRTTSTSVVPAVDGVLTDVVLIDADGDGKASPGDQLRYFLRIKNNTGGDITGVSVNVPTIANTALVNGSLQVSPLARDDGPVPGSAPGSAFHGAKNAVLSISAGQGLLANDVLGAPAATIASFGGGALGGGVTDHTAGTTATVAAGTLTVNADGSLTFTPISTLVGYFSFQYRLANALGSDDATATLAIGVRPTAAADSWNATGNVRINTSLAPAFSVLANDAGDDLAITAFQNPSAQGGTVQVSPSGVFTYDPPAGYTGSDTFTYTIANGFGNAQATVTLTVTGRVWFVNNAAGAAGDGRLSSPFNSLAGLVAVNDGSALHPAAGDAIFVYTGSGNYTLAQVGGLVLLNNQKLIGQGATAADLGTALGITFAAGSDGLPSLNGSNPVIENAAPGDHGITLAQGNTVRGLNVGNTPNGFGFFGINAGNLVLSECSKIGTGGALSLGIGTSANAVFASLSSDSAPTRAIYLNGVAGSIAANAGSIVAPVGTAVDIDGGSATLTYTGDITKHTAGRLVSIQNLTGGSVTLSGNLAQNQASGTGILIQNNTGGAITFGGASKVLNTAGNAAVSLSNNTGATISFANGGLELDTTTATSFTASGGGTISVTGGGNSLTSTSGMALNVANTTISASGLTFQSITAGGAVSSAGAGIILDTTGANGGVTVSGNGLAHSGGTIQNKTGADGSVNGNGVYLRNTMNVSLAWMQLNDFQNFAIKGNNVNGFTLANSIINGSNGNVAGEGGVGEGSVRFDNLLGAATISSTTITGGYYDNVGIFNNGGALDRLTITDSTFGSTSAFGKDALRIEAANSGTVLKTTITGSFFTAARGDLLDFLAQPNTTADVVFSNNACHNNHPSIISGGGGVIFHGSGAVTFNLLNNSFRDAKGSAINVTKGNLGVFTGTISGNSVGVAGINLSGSAQASGITLNCLGNGTFTTAVNNNNIVQYNEAGIYTAVNSGSSTMNLTLQGNTTVAYSGNGTFAFAGLFVDLGAAGGDVNTLNLLVGGPGLQKNDFRLGDPSNSTDVSLNNNLPGTAFNLFTGGSTITTPAGVINNNNVAGASVITSGTIQVVAGQPILPP